MMKKILFLLLSMQTLNVCKNNIYAAQEQPQIEQKKQPNRFSCFTSSIFSKVSHALKSTASWMLKDTYSTPTLMSEIAPYRKDISDVSEVLSLLHELKTILIEEKNINEFITNAIIKEEEPKKEQTQRGITEVLERNINKADVTIFYFLSRTHKLSEDARTLGKKLLPLQPKIIEEEVEEVPVILTQEFIQTKISLLESYQQERLMHIGEIALKYKNLPILKPIATFIANKFIFIPLKISLLITGTALLIQLGGLGTSYVIPSLREMYPSLNHVDLCLTPLYKIGSFFQQSIGSLFSSTTTPCQTTPCAVTEITKIIEKPLELYKQCSDFVHTNSVNLQNYLSEEQKIECIKRCIFEKANEDTLKLLQIFDVPK